MKKVLLALIVILAMTFVYRDNVIFASEDFDYSKITNVLTNKLQEIDDKDFISVVVMFTDNEVKKVKDFSNVDISDKNLVVAKEKLMMHRRESKLVIREYNEKYIKKLDQKYNITYISDYAPLAIIEMQAKEIYKLTKIDEVILIDLLQEVVPEDPVIDTSDEIFQTINTLIGTYSYLDKTNIDEVKSIYGVDGTGITIGILDAGRIDTTNSEFSSGVILNDATAISDHSTTVAIISAGRLHGIANESDILAVGYDTIFEEIDQLVNEGANVINCSFGLGANLGEYDALSMYLDFIVMNERVTIVKSAGNRGTSDALVTSPGAASNLVVVGSSAADSNIMSSFSSYISANDDFIKPNIVMPGGNAVSYSCGFLNLDNCTDFYALDVPNSPYDDIDIIGTSFAAPQATGAIALMMEYDATLISKPYEIMGLLSAGADTNVLSSQTMDAGSGLSIQSGAGLVDLLKTFELMDQNASFEYSNSFYIQVLWNIAQVNLLQNDTVRITLSFMRNQVEFTESPNNFGDRLDLRDYNVEVYNSTGLIAASYSTISNVEILEFVVPTSGVYTIKVRLNNRYDDTFLNLGVVVVDSDFGFTMYIPSC